MDRIYPVYGYWVWSGADLALLTGAESPIVKAIGVAHHDFAGSGVVHSIGGYAALAGILLVGARVGKFKNGKPFAIPGHNLTFAFMGTLIHHILGPVSSIIWSQPDLRFHGDFDPLPWLDRIQRRKYP